MSRMGDSCQFLETGAYPQYLVKSIFFGIVVGNSKVFAFQEHLKEIGTKLE